jgi:hypothetical protein
MTKHYKTSNNEYSQQANDESVVLEGEVLTESGEQSIEEKIAKGRAYSKSKATDAKSGADQSIKKPSWLTLYRGYVLWLLLFIVVILVLLVTRPNTAWQIQHINTLQSDVSQLYQDNQDLESRLTVQEAKELDSQQAIETAIKQALTSSENKPLVTQSDLDELKQSMQQQLITLQASLAPLKETASLQLDKAQEGAEQLLESAIDVPKSSIISEASIKPLAEKLQTQIDDLGSKLSDLFDFNSRQKALTTQQALSAFQIQQWIVEINTQWLMQGRVEQTAQQLLALEQAVELSDFPEVTKLARLIGQDLTRLELLQKSAPTDTLVNTQALKVAVSQLLDNGNKTSKANNESTSEVPATASNEKIHLGEEISSQSALDQLMARFGELVSLKKRETSGEQTQVESMIMHDVLVQRALLLVDRIDWALETESTNALSIATADLQKFIESHFGSQSLEFSDLLEPFKTVTFELRQPLAIMAVQTEL